jgi:hypothetical protein
MPTVSSGSIWTLARNPRFPGKMTLSVIFVCHDLPVVLSGDLPGVIEVIVLEVKTLETWLYLGR